MAGKFGSQDVRKLEYLLDNEYDKIKTGYEKLGKKLWKFYESVRGNKK